MRSSCEQVLFEGNGSKNKLQYHSCQKLLKEAQKK